MLKEQRPSAKMCSILDEAGYERREQFNCYLPDSSKSLNADLYVEDEDMFYEPQAEKDWQCKFSWVTTQVLWPKKISLYIFVILHFCSEQQSIVDQMAILLMRIMMDSGGWMNLIQRIIFLLKETNMLI